jgi:Raf kinase inhibitor-like YbhB/YbcL family protein
VSDYDPYARLDPVASFDVRSTDIIDEEPLPTEQMAADCGGHDRSPQLSWSGAPEGTQSYAVTVFDPDAPTGSGFWHWAVYNIPASVTQLPSAAGDPDSGQLPTGAVTLPNEYRQTEYTGAAPPPGTGPHRAQSGPAGRMHARRAGLQPPLPHRGPRDPDGDGGGRSRLEASGSSAECDPHRS